MKTQSKIQSIPIELIHLRKNLFDKLNLSLSDFEFEKESREYEASSFRLNQKVVLYRKAKITPTKSGQFVTLWKRNGKKIIEPFQDSDPFDFLIVLAKTEFNLGIFIFSKSILIEQGILSIKENEGKRAFRIYAAWDLAENKQSIKTKKWQTEFFLNLSELEVDLDFAKNLLAV
ncbi:MAG: MepB family protein [Leptospiraceae bacterium]|nr:MepB family protein [Leptospiraceae bacterium]